MPLSAASISKRLRLRVRGIVQGVGFRPFVYQLAARHALKGFVLNDGEGVLIEVEGDTVALDAFVGTLSDSPPPLARIDEVTRENIPSVGEAGFVIRPSAPTEARTMVSPDMAICDACAAELKDPENRRYRYPLINCTDCGPRYSIIRTLPYDRPNTSMHGFAMCPECHAEYNDPANRRYHAQPISCFACGPQLQFMQIQGETRVTGTEDVLARSVETLKAGGIVAVKGMGGFHLVCDASNETALQTLRERKRRPTKPFAVMFPSLESIKTVAEISEAEARLILSKERPIVIVGMKPDLPTGSVFAEGIAPGIDRIGVFLPYTPLHILLLEQLGRPVVATSANLSDEPIITDAAALQQKLGHVVDAILDHERPIINACDDSVVMAAGAQPVMLRMARGYAPGSLPMPLGTAKKILAVGAHQKSAIALAFGQEVVLSPHIGDLNTLDAVEYFDRTVGTFKRFYGFEPEVIVCDKHPGYESTKWAEAAAARSGAAVVKVQHHYAHALACMAEYGLDETVLAFCFDGTGYGDDGTLWGGEVLLADPRRYERAFYLRPFGLPGGEKAVREPRRVALSLLFECYSLEAVLAMDNPTVRSFTAAEINTLHTMWERGLNTPRSSSVGRLFDAVASLAGVAQTLGYEGESGLLLEAAAAGAAATEAFAFALKGEEIDWEPLLRKLPAVSAAAAAAGLHTALAELIIGIARRYPGKPVVLSGGVFQNRTLVTMTAERLEAAGIRYYLQRATPVNDGGIALGQLYHVLHREHR